VKVGKRLEYLCTCDKCEGTEAGKGRNIDFHGVQRSAEFKNRRQPVAKSAGALLSVQHYAIAERESLILGPRPSKQNQLLANGSIIK